MNISKIKEFANIHVEIIIHSLKQNNLYLSYPSNMQIITQEQLNVDIFSSQESWSGAAPVSLLQIFAIFAILANIWTSEHNVRLASKLKYNIAHKYPCLSEYSVFECRLYSLTISQIPLL